LEPKPVALIVRWYQIKTQAASGRIDEAEQLRVIKENIDVMAFAMTDLDHHRRPTAKRPFEAVAASILSKLVNQVDSDVKKPPPFGRAPASLFGHHAASG
jgi:hypothetical protein